MKTIRPTTKDAIINSAFIALNANSGASLGKIAEIAGVGRATLHRYFPNRATLIEALALLALDETEAAAIAASADAQSYSEAVRLIFFAMIPLGDRYWFLANEPLDQFPRVQEKRAIQDTKFDRLLGDAKAEGFAHADCPVSWIARTYDHLIYAVWETVREGSATEKQASELAWATLAGGLKNAKFQP